MLLSLHMRFLFNMKNEKLDHLTQEELSMYYGYFHLVSFTLRTLFFILGS